MSAYKAALPLIADDGFVFDMFHDTGRLALDMVSEFLEYYELVQSKPIYTAESGLV